MIPGVRRAGGDTLTTLLVPSCGRLDLVARAQTIVRIGGIATVSLALLLA
jgi:hypothetical protein